MSLHTIVPNKLPPNVGRVTSNNDSPFSLAYSKSTSILVASAVRPTFKRAATRGANHILMEWHQLTLNLVCELKQLVLKHLHRIELNSLLIKHHQRLLCQLHD